MGRSMRNGIQMGRSMWDYVIVVSMSHMIIMGGRMRNVIDMSRGMGHVVLGLSRFLMHCLHVIRKEHANFGNRQEVALNRAQPERSVSVWGGERSRV